MNTYWFRIESDPLRVGGHVKADTVEEATSKVLAAYVYADNLNIIDDSGDVEVSTVDVVAYKLTAEHIKVELV